MPRFQSIADARRHHGYTQATLAEQIGVNRSAVAQWEMKDGTRPDPNNALLLAQLLPGLTLDVIFRQRAA